MRVVFEPPTEEEFIELFFFTPQGGSLKDITVYSPRGGGLFSVLGGLLRKAAPFLMKTIAPAAVEFGKGVLDDVVGREPFKQSLKKRGLDALRGVGKKLVEGGGGGRRRKEIRRNKKRKKNIIRYKEDVFSML